MQPDSFRSINPTQILLIFESMQYCRNDQEQEKVFEHFFFVFMPHVFLTYTWCFVVIQGDHV